jgi:hypothetical protein
VKTEHLYRWRIKWGGRWVTTRNHWTEEHIRKEHPEAQRIESSLEVRSMAETAAEREAQTFRGFGFINAGDPALVYGRPEPTESPRRPHTCMLCDGEGWVCEEHNDVPWLACSCDAGRLVCLCNPWRLVTCCARASSHGLQR